MLPVVLAAPILVLALHCSKSFGSQQHHEHDETGRRRARSVGCVFTSRLANEAPRNLGNPCGSSSRTSESPGGLGVSGREATVRGMAQNMLAAVGSLNASLVRSCSCKEKYQINVICSKNLNS